MKKIVKINEVDPLQELLQRKFFDNNININLDLGDSAHPQPEKEEECGCEETGCPICSDDTDLLNDESDYKNDNADGSAYINRDAKAKKTEGNDADE